MRSPHGLGSAQTIRSFRGLEGLEPRLLMAGDGLKGEYFNNKDLTALVVTRTDPTVDFLFKGNAPAPGVDKDTFSIRWTGFVEPLYSQTYTFQTTSDDGVRLWVNDQLLINQWTNHAVQTHTGTIALQAGQKYSIRMEHYDNLGDATARLWWSSASQALQIIPQSQLYSSGTVTPQPGTIAFTSSSASVNESAGTVTLNLARSGGSSGAVSVDYSIAPGSATANDDYDPTGGTVTFADGQTSRTIVVPIVDDTQEEPNETFIVTISDPQGGAAVGSPSSSTVTILANDAPTPPPGSTGDGLKGEYFDNKDLTNLIVTRIDPKIDFIYGGSSPAPGVGADTFSTRWTGFVEPLYSQTYTFQTASDDGVRLWVNDQLLINQWTNHATQTHTGTIALQAGVKYAIKMEHYDNLGGATARLWWQSASQALEIIPQSQLFSGVAPTPNAGTLSLATSSHTVQEHDGTLTITVNRSNGSEGAVTVNYATTAQTATAGSDYTTTTGTLTFDAGVTQQTFNIPILNDPSVEPDQTFAVALSSPGGGATLGPTTTATVTIEDNDGTPGGKRIVVLGSSSVDGSSERNSFRRPLDALLDQAGYAVNFVGTRNLNGGSTPPNIDFDRDHEGFGGYRADEVLNGRSSAGVPSLATRLTGLSADGDQLTPDLALLYVGHNDLFQNQTPENVRDDLAGIIAALRADNASVAILLGKLAPSDWDNGTHNDEIATLNTLIDALVSSSTTTQSPVVAVDLNAGFDPGVYTTDGQHPNPAGEAFMADRWFAAMQPILDAAPTSPGTLALESNSYSVNENAGTVTLAVVRTGGSDGEVGVEFTTVDGTATAGDDYQATVGTVTLPDGVTRKTFTIPLINDNIGEPFESFGVSLDRVLGGANLSQPRTATITITDDDGVTSDNGDGLKGQYFNNEDFTSLVLTRVDPTINFNYGSNGPATGVGSETFSIRWSGQILPRFTETYTFTTTSDDGIRLWVNNQLIIDHWVPHAASSKSGTIALQAGQKVNIRIDYYERTGNAQARLFWASASQASQVVPQSQLFSTGYTGDVGIALKATTIVTGLNLPTAMRFLPNGNMIITEKDGLVRAVKDGQLQSTPFLDLRSIVNSVGDRGLLGLAVHPDFAANPYVYVMFPYDPPETLTRTGYGGPDGLGSRGTRLMRFTADAATDYTTAVPNSGVVILGTNSDWQYYGAPEVAPSMTNPYGGENPDGTYVQDSLPIDSGSHVGGDMTFLPDGSMLVTTGDGTHFGTADLKARRVQHIDSLNGKLLRIDPITGDALPDNPYYDGNPDSNRSKVVAVGFRNPFRVAVNPANQKIYIGDVGWKSWEEINLITYGANYGWPWYEGAEGVLAQTPSYKDTAEAQAFYNSGTVVTPAVIARSHDQGNIAIVVGEFVQSDVYGAIYNGALLFSDYGTGLMDTALFNPDGSVNTVDRATGNFGAPVDMTPGADGYMYFVDITGRIARIEKA